MMPDDQVRQLAATLVRIARTDRPTRAAYHRVLRAMAKAGVAGSLLAGSSAGAAISSKSVLSAIPLPFVKYVAVAAIGGALAVSAPKIVAHVALLHREHVAVAPEAPKGRVLRGHDRGGIDVRSSRAESTDEPPFPVQDAAPSAVASSDEALPFSAPGAPQPLRPSFREGEHRLAAAGLPRASGDVLLAEVAELDRARALLVAGTPNSALSALDAYTARYPNGNLRLEAMALRIEALAKSGRKGPAIELAKQFLASHAHTPLAYRVREMLGALGARRE